MRWGVGRWELRGGSREVGVGSGMRGGDGGGRGEWGMGEGWADRRKEVEKYSQYGYLI